MSHPAKNNDTLHQSGQREADTSQPLSADHVCRLLKIDLEPSKESRDTNGLRDALGQMEHTPGPWATVANQHGQFDVAADNGEGDMICDLAHCNNAEANAPLIAAAPELLEVAPKALAHLDAWHSGEFTEEKELARAAIARAEGRTP